MLTLIKRNLEWLLIIVQINFKAKKKLDGIKKVTS